MIGLQSERLISQYKTSNELLHNQLAGNSTNPFSKNKTFELYETPESLMKKLASQYCKDKL